ncbi:hypothetical protein EPI10_020880 [Gossypium australe]|uniref:Uncharacterized protein n=1 Tax=Gossypium australe TaxID=47621 RepID=A0A5B6WGI3_9ROSI|nr:hypothetical protein EPI10_020880 [Gossypium australe]
MGSLMTLFALGPITTWDELVGKFLQKFFLIGKTVQLRGEILISARTIDCLSGYNCKFSTMVGYAFKVRIRWSSKRSLDEQNVQGCVRIDRRYDNEFFPVAN